MLVCLLSFCNVFLGKLILAFFYVSIFSRIMPNEKMPKNATFFVVLVVTLNDIKKNKRAKITYMQIKNPNKS